MYSLNGPRITITSSPRARSRLIVRWNALHCSESTRGTQSKCDGAAPPEFQGLCRGLDVPRSGSAAGSLGTRSVMREKGLRQPFGQRGGSLSLSVSVQRGTLCWSKYAQLTWFTHEKKLLWRIATAPRRVAASAR